MTKKFTWQEGDVNVQENEELTDEDKAILESMREATPDPTPPKKLEKFDAIKKR